MNLAVHLDSQPAPKGGGTTLMPPRSPLGYAAAVASVRLSLVAWSCVQLELAFGLPFVPPSLDKRPRELRRRGGDGPNGSRPVFLKHNITSICSPFNSSFRG
jgi:hypothetical protein